MQATHDNVFNTFQIKKSWVEEQNCMAPGKSTEGKAVSRFITNKLQSIYCFVGSRWAEREKATALRFSSPSSPSSMKLLLLAAAAAVSQKKNRAATRAAGWKQCQQNGVVNRSRAKESVTNWVECWA